MELKAVYTLGFRPGAPGMNPFNGIESGCYTWHFRRAEGAPNPFNGIESRLYVYTSAGTVSAESIQWN
jgi:hypothetical protein